MILELAFRPRRLGAMALIFSCCLIGQSVYSADPACAKWFERSAKKIQSNCELDCATFGTDMGTYHCLNACEDLCSELKHGAASRPGRFLYYPGLTEAERKLVEQNPKEAIVVFVQKTRAEMSSSRIFPSQRFNDEGDAFRHFMWSGLVTKELGVARAKSYLDAHETDPAQPPAERSMDEMNNEMGQTAAQSLSTKGEWGVQDLERVGLEALRKKKLRVLNPGLGVPEEVL